MKVALITGSAGLIGSEAVEFFASKFDRVIGIDNNLRQYFFGDDGSTNWRATELKEKFNNYFQYNCDIRDRETMKEIFAEYSSSISLIIHTAAQPSHDWAAKEPFTDFSVNAMGTLNMLELTRRYCHEAVFIFTSTNKVYGDTPNFLPLIEKEKRFECEMLPNGIDETMSIDQTKHSLFGASKVAADVLVQEYGKYFGMKTVVFRGGCLTGPNHSGAQLHGFLSYLMKCAIDKTPYTIFGYKGKQVRDNIHASDLVNMFWHFYQNPKNGGPVYNAGGGRGSECSVLEAIEMGELITGNKMNFTISEQNRIGDHIWYVTDFRKFQRDYPQWTPQVELIEIMQQIFNAHSTIKM